VPTYTFRCPACGTVRETFASVTEKEASTPSCCGQKSETVIQPSYGYVQSQCHYRCPVTREGVTTWKQRREIFARNNLTDMSDVNFGKEIAKAERKKEEQAALAAKMPFYGEHPKTFN
jgi:putative FmdB family regulatory protein